MTRLCFFMEWLLVAVVEVDDASTFPQRAQRCAPSLTRGKLL
jgi:hypothetical protein